MLACMKDDTMKAILLLLKPMCLGIENIQTGDIVSNSLLETGILLKPNLVSKSIVKLRAPAAKNTLHLYISLLLEELQLVLSGDRGQGIHLRKSALLD